MTQETFNKKWLHYLLLLLGILCISWSAILVKKANVSGFASAFYRMLFGCLGLIPIWLFKRKPIGNIKAMKFAIICGILFACDIALWNSSIMLSKASISTLLANMAPVWVGLGTLIFMKEKPGIRFWIGSTIAIAGIAIIVGIHSFSALSIQPGIVLALIASMFYGAYLIIARKGRNKLDTFAFTSVSMISSTVVLGCICLASQTPVSGFAGSSWLALITLGIVPQLIGWLAINQALGHIKPTIASVSLLSQSVFTALFSIPILGEQLTFNEIAGIFIVLTGIYFVNKTTN